MNILFVNVNGLDSNSDYGGPKGTIRNFKCLQKCGNVIPYTVPNDFLIVKILSVILGYFPPISRRRFSDIKSIILKENIDVVFFDQSFYGSWVPKVKKMGCKAIIFCHNCEKDFLEVRFAHKGKSFKHFVYKNLIERNEGIALRSADIICTFLERDSRRVEACYPGIKVNYEIPLAMEDKLSSPESVISDNNDSCLIFGPATNVNIIGVRWFVKNVSPYLNCKTIVAGKGMDNYRSELETNKVTVEGYVASLDDIYRKSNIVVIPQLEGAGMKVKTVESLMYGKYVVGTKEAFEGFNIDIDRIGAICNTAEDFINVINRYITEKLGFNSEARDIYERLYSVEASLGIFQKIISEL